MTDDPRPIGELAEEIVNDIRRQRENNVLPFAPRPKVDAGDYPDEAA